MSGSESSLGKDLAQLHAKLVVGNTVTPGERYELLALMCEFAKAQGRRKGLGGLDAEVFADSYLDRYMGLEDGDMSEAEARVDHLLDILLNGHLDRYVYTSVRRRLASWWARARHDVPLGPAHEPFEDPRREQTGRRGPDPWRDEFRSALAELTPREQRILLLGAERCTDDQILEVVAEEFPHEKPLKPGNLRVIRHRLIVRMEVRLGCPSVDKARKVSHRYEDARLILNELDHTPRHLREGYKLAFLKGVPMPDVPALLAERLGGAVDADTLTSELTALHNRIKDLTEDRVKADSLPKGIKTLLLELEDEGLGA